MSKSFLILQACGHKDEPLEIENIKSQAALYRMNTVVKCINHYDNLHEALTKNGQFDYIYLSSHGDDQGFCNTRKTLEMSWLDFGNLVCETDCLNSNCILLLSCCRGGLNEVAYDMFWMCSDIEYVVGPRQILISSDLLIGFNLLLYNLEHRGVDPIVACDKVQSGTDIRFKCFDRMETMSDPAYIARKQVLDKEINGEETLK